MSYRFAIFCLLFSFQILNSMERDYSYRGDYFDEAIKMIMEEEDQYDHRGNLILFYNSNMLCYRCFNKACYNLFPKKHTKEFEIELIPYIKNCWGDYECYLCDEDDRIYSGYLHFRYKGGYPFLKRQIAYTGKYPYYEAFWPETSIEAKDVSDTAVVLFKDLVEKTSLKNIIDNKYLLDKFITDSWSEDY